MKTENLELARIMIMVHKASPFPDRPMHPDAKMTGGDIPIWDDNHADRVAIGEIPPGSLLSQKDNKIKNYWLSCGNDIRFIDTYQSSEKNSFISGEINGNF